MLTDIISAVRTSLGIVQHPRYFQSERGYQGAFQAQLSQLIPKLILDGAIVEEEYQKRIRDHGINIRPDVIVHIPFDTNILESRNDGNFIAIELKLHATKIDALADYNKLATLCEHLSYPLGVFINIGSHNTFLADYSGAHKTKLYAFGVVLVDGQVEVREENAT